MAEIQFQRDAIDPMRLSAMLQQEFPPTEQQAAVIGAPMESLLVVAGAGAGKTATMAARVVWLVANGFIRPEEVLGLTFTRKAARELGTRVRQQLQRLAGAKEFRRVAAPEVLESLEVIAPTTATYDAYASQVVGNYGLLLPTEPGVSIVDDATRWQYAWEIAQKAKKVQSEFSPATMADLIIKLNDQLDANLAEVAEVCEETEAFIQNILQTPPRPGSKSAMLSVLEKVLIAQRKRQELLPFVAELRERLAAENQATFTMQMARAARLANGFSEVSTAERRRFKLIMLDEYQDTSHPQRIFLRSLFAGSCVTAVGDPMQAIYGWRGATADNLTKFVTDFPRSDGSPAEIKQLTVSWRNPSDVLALANVISDRAFAATPRSVERLESGPKAGHGEVELAQFNTGEEEVTYIADYLAEEYQRCQAAGTTFDAAVLVRTNEQSPPFLDALAQRGVPAVIVGLAGLLRLPEILDITSVLKALVEPASDEDMLRLLLGPRYNLGAHDVGVLHTRVRQLARVGTTSAADADLDSTGELAAPGDARSAFAARLNQLVRESAGMANRVGLAHAIADPDIRYQDGTRLAEGNIADNGPLVSSDSLPYTAAGMQRITELGASLRYLRRFSLSKPLPELVEDVIAEFGIRVEAAAGRYGEATAIERPTAAHLDHFVTIAADFAQHNSDDVRAFLGYLSNSEDHSDGLGRAPQPVPDNCVHILTMHKSKGLEWDIVAVPRVNAESFDKFRVSDWTTNAHLLPPGAVEQESDVELAANTADFVDPDAPALDISAVENQTELSKALDEYKKQQREVLAEEAQRLLYVAVTRSAEKLLVTSSIKPKPKLKKPDAAAADLVAITKQFPQFVSSWASAAPSAADTEEAHGSDEAHGADDAVADTFEPSLADGAILWPHDSLGAERDLTETAAAQVQQYLDQPTQETPLAGDLSQVWEQETSIVVDEITRARANEMLLPMPRSLSTSEYQAFVADPAEFARRKARPVPFKPNRFSRRGTAFHAWLENRFGAHTLLDDDDLYAAGLGDFLEQEQPLSEVELEQLKANFVASEWANRTPEYVEEPFEITVGSRRIVGRIDAIFRIDGTWMVVDWKTGRPPSGRLKEIAALQLAIYRLAWAQRLSTQGQEVAPEQIRAAFYYVGADRTVEPESSTLPGRLELDRKMREILADVQHEAP